MPDLIGQLGQIGAYTYTNKPKSNACEYATNDIELENDNDNFRSEVVEQEVASQVANPLTGILNSLCSFSSILTETVGKVIGFFSPVLNFVNNVGIVSGTQNENTGKLTVDQFTDALSDVLTKIDNDKSLSESLSPGAKQRLQNLKTVVSELAQREDLQDLNLSELIQRWRNTRDAQALLRMAEIMRNPEECGQSGIRFTNEELRRTFINGLESLGLSLEELLANHPDPRRERARAHIVSAADSLVDAEERLLERGSDENLTSEDRNFIRERFRDSTRSIQSVTDDPELSDCLEYTCSGLKQWVKYIYKIIENMFEEREEMRKEEEKLEKEKLC